MLYSKQTPAAGGTAFSQFDAAWAYDGNGYIYNDTGTSLDVRIGASGSVQTLAAGGTLPIRLVYSLAELYVRRTDQATTQVTVEAQVGTGSAGGGGSTADMAFIAAASTAAHNTDQAAHATCQPWVAGFRQTVPFTSDVFTEVKTGLGSTVRRGVAGSVSSGSTAGGTAFLKSDMGGAIGFVPVPWFGDASGYTSPDWRKTIVFDMIISGQGAQAADGVARWTIGKITGSLGDIPRLGIQLSLKGAGAASRLWLGVHNGTTFSESDTGFVLNRSWAAYAVKIISRAGTVELYVNDALASKAPTFTKTGGPAIKDATGSQVWYTLETTNGTSAADHRMDINLLTVSTVY